MVNEKMRQEFCVLRDKVIEMEYVNLNKEQREAVLTTNGSILILAGAGSGKTTVLVNRIANLLKYSNIYKSNSIPDNLKEEDIILLKEWLKEDKKLINQEFASRVSQIVGTSGVYPSQILAITFTNKAAGEMRSRVRDMIGEEADNMWISTFHSSCVRILRREADKLGYNKNFTIYDSYDQKSLIKQCMLELKINDKEITDKEIISKIGEQKDNLVSAEKYKKNNSGNYRTDKIADVYLLYQKKLKSSNAMDFDDLIVKTVELFQKNLEVLQFYQRKFKYIMVDEYQDTNKAQYEMVKLLAASNKNICVVGDDDQCIYAWRGADIRNILDFEKDYSSCKVIKLEQNYRSKGNILKAANVVIKNNAERKSKILRTDREDGEKIKIYRAYSDMDEASFVSNQIKSIKSEENKSFKDFAILYRTNSQSRIFEDNFIRNDIPYRIIGGLKFYDRKEIKDIMAYLKLINNPLDDVSLKRVINVPKRSIGDSTVLKIQDFASYMEECLYSTILDIENIPGLTARSITSINKFTSLINSFIRIKDEISVSKLIEEILNQTGYLKELKSSNEPDDLSRVENLEELVSAAVDFENNSEEKTLAAFLEKIALVSDIDNFDSEADTVVLMTVHSAKGLEFPVVFMVGMENGIFPGLQSLNDPKEMEESRRLCYVGITRAKEKLFMTSAEVRMVFGRTVAYGVSDFISEIAPGLKEFVNNAKSNQNKNISNIGYSNRSQEATTKVNNFYKDTPVAKCTNKTLTKEDAKPGNKVMHTKFGIGTIVTVSNDGASVKLTIAFNNMGIKILMLDVAPLELVIS